MAGSYRRSLSVPLRASAARGARALWGHRLAARPGVPSQRDQVSRTGFAKRLALREPERSSSIRRAVEAASGRADRRCAEGADRPTPRRRRLVAVGAVAVTVTVPGIDASILPVREREVDEDRDELIRSVAGAVIAVRVVTVVAPGVPAESMDVRSVEVAAMEVASMKASAMEVPAVEPSAMASMEMPAEVAGHRTAVPAMAHALRQGPGREQRQPQSQRRDTDEGTHVPSHTPPPRVTKSQRSCRRCLEASL